MKVIWGLFEPVFWCIGVALSSYYVCYKFCLTFTLVYFAVHHVEKIAREESKLLQSEGNSIGRQGKPVERLLVGIFIYLFTSKVEKNRN